MGLFSTKIDEGNVKTYENAVKAIDMYISAGSFNKAIKAAEEILEKEQQALEAFLNTSEERGISQREISQFKDDFNKKKTSIITKKEKALRLEEKYLLKIKEENFKILFKNTKKQIKQLIKLHKPDEAMNILKSLIQEHKDKPIALKYYNKEKAKIYREINKQKSISRKKLQNNTHLEAMTLLGQETKAELLAKQNGESAGKKIQKFFKSIIYGKQYKFWKKIKQGLEEDKLIREYKELLKKDEETNPVNLEKKLESINKGLVKELRHNTLVGYNLYGKILGESKISGDTFGIEERKNDYIIHLGDSTGRGVKAGIIVTLLHKTIKKFAGKTFQEMLFEVNNALKQGLESHNFITGVFLKLEKETQHMEYVGMGHEPIMIYNNKTRQTQKKILGGLALGIRTFTKIEDIVIRRLDIENNDIIMIFSDGIIETRNEADEMYGIDRLQKSFDYICGEGIPLNKIYEYIIEEIRIFKGNTTFTDDASIILLQRNENKDILEQNDYDFLDEIEEREGLSRKEMKSLIGKSKTEVLKKVEEIKKRKRTKQVINILKDIYNNGDILKLKEESIRYIKEGYIHKDINNYLKKAIEKETHYKIEQKNTKMHNKYKVLEELYKKGDYNTVIKEIENIIANDGEV